MRTRVLFFLAAVVVVAVGVTVLGLSPLRRTAPPPPEEYGELETPEIAPPVENPGKSRPEDTNAANSVDRREGLPPPPVKAAAGPPDFADFDLARLLRRLHEGPSAAEWRERSTASGRWTFDHLQEALPMVGEIRKRFPDTPIPREIVAALLSYRSAGPMGEAAQKALESWPVGAIRAEILAICEAPDGGSFREVLSSLCCLAKRHGRPISGEVALALLGHESADVRRAAMQAAWHAEPIPAAEILSRTGSDPDPRVREAGIWDLTGWGIVTREQAAPILLAALEDEDADLRLSAVRELPVLGPLALDAAAGLVQEGGLRKNEMTDVAKVFFSCGRIADLERLDPRGEYLEAIVKACSDEEVRRRYALRLAKRNERIAELKRNATETELRRVAFDPSLPSMIRTAALLGLGGEGGWLAVRSEAEKLLFRADTPPELRRALLDQAVRWGSQPDDPWRRATLLRVAADDPNFWVRARARSSLE